MREKGQKEKKNDENKVANIMQYITWFWALGNLNKLFLMSNKKLLVEMSVCEYNTYNVRLPIPHISVFFLFSV